MNRSCPSVWRLARLLLLLLALILTLAPVQAQEGRHVDLLQMDGVIDPTMAQYISRGLDLAVDDGALAVIIEMNTPGGLDTSMRRIISRMLASPLPVVVYVAPSGSRAASAGVFITMAANVAAMAPSTNIGSAHPVSGEGADIQGDMREKVTNDAAAYIRAIAEQRGRNAAWAEQAVRESVNITESEAVEQHVVEFVATDLRDLLDQLDGRQVTTTTGPVTLHTEGIAVKRVDMTLLEQMMHLITNPTLAYLFLTIGIWALIAEFSNPGAIFPGVVGAICLILAFIASESLPLNWGGVALIILSVILFIADIKMPSHGVLTVGGSVAFILGSIILFSPANPELPSMPTGIAVPWPWIALMSGLSIFVFSVAIGAGLRAQMRKVSSGVETVMGATGYAKTDLAPRGIVYVLGEEWSAAAAGRPIANGENVRVVGREGLTLIVAASDNGQPGG